VRADLVHDDRQHEQDGERQQDPERRLQDPPQVVTIP
jgi:hypothetical protein